MSNSMQKFVRQLTADKKKFALMTGLLVVALVMWLRMMLPGGNLQPAKATAGGGAAANAVAKADLSERKKRPVIEVELSESSVRNLFDLKTDQFTRIAKQTTQVPQNSVVEPSEEQKRTQAAAALKTVKLRSTVMSANPQAFINDRLYSVGSQPVPGFVITRIEEYRVVLKHDQFQGEFELKMYRD